MADRWGQNLLGRGRGSCCRSAAAEQGLWQSVWGPEPAEERAGELPQGRAVGQGLWQTDGDRTCLGEVGAAAAGLQQQSRGCGSQYGGQNLPMRGRESCRRAGQ